MTSPASAPAPAAAATTKTVRLRIKRQDSPDAPSYWQEFDVPYKPKFNVISCLQHVAENPVTVDGRPATPVIWDCNCLEEVCGACSMLINGRVRQSCSALIDALLEETSGGAIELAPMGKFPIVRDLMVDRARMFANLIKTRAWVPIDGTHNMGFGPTESQDQQDVRYSLSRCMTCGCCLEACPQFQLDNDFQGAQVWCQVRYFNGHKTGGVLKDQRLEAVMLPGGINDCGNAQNCVEVCPKEIPLTESIADVGRQVTIYAIRRFFSGK